MTQYIFSKSMYDQANLSFSERNFLRSNGEASKNYLTNYSCTIAIIKITNKFLRHKKMKKDVISTNGMLRTKLCFFYKSQNL